MTRLINASRSLSNSIGLRLRGSRVGWLTYAATDASSRLEVGSGGRLRGRVRVGRNATLQLGVGADVEGGIVVGDNCTLIIGDGFKLRNAWLMVQENSQAYFGKDCLIASVAPLLCRISVTNQGSLKTGDNCNLRRNIAVDGGAFSAGSNVFINEDGDIRCEEAVSIGDFVSTSYFVDVYDTNSHSTDWRQRRQELLDGYPNETVRGVNAPRRAPIRIEDDVWIGKRAALLKGVTLGARSIVGMHSVVSGSSALDSLLAGNPAQVLRRMTASTDMESQPSP